MPKYSEYPEKTAPSDNDVFAIEDSAASNASKRITRGNFLSGSPLPADTVDTQAIEDDAVTAAKIADAAVTPEKLIAGAGTSWVMQTATPTYTGITVGNGTVVARYLIVGKWCIFEFHLTCGTTTTISDGYTISVPSAAHARYATANYTTPVGGLIFSDVSTGTLYTGQCGFVVSTTAVSGLITVSTGSGQPSTASSNMPVAEANGDVLSLSACYEVA